MKKIVLRVLAILLIPAICIGLLQKLLMPKYAFEIQEGAMIKEYYDSEKDNQVLILGDCEVYENISPVTMWKEYGITSYIRGSAEQLIWQSYYILKDTLKYETPKVVVLNVLAMQEGEAKSEAYNRMTLDGMRWSQYKLHSIQESMTEQESLFDYLFPIARYHTRWSEISKEDFSYAFRNPVVTTNGYLMQVGTRPVTTIPKAGPLANYSFSDKCYEYLDKIRMTCKENNIQLILMKAPSIYPYWYEQWDQQIQQYAQKYQLAYLNMIQKANEIGIDYTTDTFDSGQHLNVYGAEKLSVYLGKILKTQFQLQDTRESSKKCEEWNKIVQRYNDEKDKKLKN